MIITKISSQSNLPLHSLTMYLVSGADLGGVRLAINYRMGKTNTFCAEAVKIPFF